MVWAAPALLLALSPAWAGKSAARRFTAARLPPAAAPLKGVPVPPSAPGARIPELSVPAVAFGAAPVPAAEAVPQALPQLELAASRALKAGWRGSRAHRFSGREDFDGDARGASACAAAQAPDYGASSAEFVINDEGVTIFGRAAAYYKESRRLIDKYQDKIDLSESLDVMDDTYGDVWAKLAALDALAAGRPIELANIHLKRTLTWVDGVVYLDGKRTAIHTHRVYYHRAKNPKSEIAEGVRRVDGELNDLVRHFSRGGKADRALGGPERTILVFDTRGYKEIREHIASRAAEVARASGGRVELRFLDDLVKVPRSIDAVRRGLNDLIQKHKKDLLRDIIEGVIYSRYVGLLLELKTIEHYHKLGWTILQSGRELFDESGMYVTELDLVVRDRKGRIYLVEAKSSRVSLPRAYVINNKIERKLKIYKRFKKELERMIGRRIDTIVFAMDLGPNQGLAPWLEGQKNRLQKLHGFPVEFLFLDSSP